MASKRQKDYAKLKRKDKKANKQNILSLQKENKALDQQIQTQKTKNQKLKSFHKAGIMIGFSFYLASLVSLVVRTESETLRDDLRLRLDVQNQLDSNKISLEKYEGELQSCQHGDSTRMTQNTNQKLR